MKTKSLKARWTCAQVLKELKAMGTDQNKKIFRNHGATGEIYGVSYANLKALDKKVPVDQELAEDLWATDILDARVMACWKADEHAVTRKGLDAWARDVNNHGIAFELAALAAYTVLGADRSRKWRKMKHEWRAAMGWRILASLAMQPDRPVSEGGVLDEELSECLEEIEAGIHSAPNRIRQNMNIALISIGCRPSMTKATLPVAKRVGVVDVDQGNTSCKTPIAHDRIKKTVAHYKAKGKKPTDGTGGQRRRHC